MLSPSPLYTKEFTPCSPPPPIYKRIHPMLSPSYIQKNSPHALPLPPIYKRIHPMLSSPFLYTKEFNPHLHIQKNSTPLPIDKRIQPPISIYKRIQFPFPIPIYKRIQNLVLLVCCCLLLLLFAPHAIPPSFGKPPPRRGLRG